MERIPKFVGRHALKLKLTKLEQKCAENIASKHVPVTI